MSNYALPNICNINSLNATKDKVCGNEFCGYRLIVVELMKKFQSLQSMYLENFHADSINLFSDSLEVKTNEPLDGIQSNLVLSEEMKTTKNSIDKSQKDTKEEVKSRRYSVNFSQKSYGKKSEKDLHQSRSREKTIDKSKWNHYPLLRVDEDGNLIAPFIVEKVTRKERHVKMEKFEKLNKSCEPCYQIPSKKRKTNKNVPNDSPKYNFSLEISRSVDKEVIDLEQSETEVKGLCHGFESKNDEEKMRSSPKESPNILQKKAVSSADSSEAKLKKLKRPLKRPSTMTDSELIKWFHSVYAPDEVYSFILSHKIDGNKKSYFVYCGGEFKWFSYEEVLHEIDEKPRLKEYDASLKLY